MPPQIVAGGIHLVNSNGTPTAGGTATAASTTPFSIRGNWLLAAAEQQPILSGGPPFSVGSRPLYLGYDNVTETIPIAVQGSSHFNAVAKLQELKRAINTTLFSTPALLSVLPDGSSIIMYSEILYARVAEVPDGGGFDAWQAFDSELWAEITWVRAPFFSPAGLTTLQSGVTYTNSGTGVNNNTQSLTTISGDLLYEGSPLNIKIDPVTGGQYFYLATVYQRTYDTSGAGTGSTSSTTFTNFFVNGTPGTDPARIRKGLRLRVMLRCTSISAKTRVRFVLAGYDTANAVWIGPEVAGNATGVTQIDVTPNGVPLDMIRAFALTTGETIGKLQYRSTDGTSVTLNLHSVEYLLYYTFCRIDATNSVGANDFLQIEQASNLNGTAYVPTNGRSYVVFNNVSLDGLGDICDVRGTLPKAISGASLYLSWLQASYVFLGTDTAAVTVNHLPLFRSLRGNG